MNTATQTTNKFAIGLGAAACALLLSFFLPWIQAGLGSYSSVSMSWSWVDYITTAGNPWTKDAQSLLIVFGASAALACAFFIVVKGLRTPPLLGLALLSFAGAAVGSVWFLVQFNQTFGLSSSSSVSPGPGLWLYLLAAFGGGFAAFRLLNPVSASPAPLSVGQLPPLPGAPTAGYEPAVAPPWVAQPPLAAPAGSPAPPAPPAVAPPAPPAAVSTPPAAASIPPVPASALTMRVCPGCSVMVGPAARFCPLCGFALNPNS